MADRAEGERKLAAILSADVAGYSRLMENDEAATVRTLTDYREVFRDHIERHRGRVVDAPGDNLMAEFASPVEAVGCAVEVQRELSRRNGQLAEHRRMDFRVGINLGDVLERDGALFGSGVNIAARMEALAEPGAICVSGTVHEHVGNVLDVAFEDLGEQAIKNIDRPVRCYRVRSHLDAAANAPARRTDTPPPLTDKPSIAVLPFNNLSDDPGQEYFADGIAEDLITELSRLRWLLVTARNSTFSYKGQAVDVRQVGRDLGVRYVVEGSVRKAGERVRITAQLVDAATGNHIWAERYDRELADIFALQDEITETLVAALQGEVGEFERERAHRKPPGSLDAWDSYQRGMWHLWRFNAEDLSEARRLFERAADLDPNFALAVAALGYALFLQVVNSYTDSPLETLEQASRLANKAVALDDKEAMAHFAVGRVQTMRGEYDAAIPELRTAIDLNPSLALAHFGLAFAFVRTGQLDKAISELYTAIRLSPRDPVVHEFYSVRALARLLSGDYEAAVENARRAIRHPAAGFWPHAHLASALAHLDRREEAKIARDKLLEVEPNFSPDALLAAFSPLNPEALRPLFKTWIDGLRKAGLDIPGKPRAAD